MGKVWEMTQARFEPVCLYMAWYINALHHSTPTLHLKTTFACHVCIFQWELLLVVKAKGFYLSVFLCACLDIGAGAAGGHSLLWWPLGHNGPDEWRDAHLFCHLWTGTRRVFGGKSCSLCNIPFTTLVVTLFRSHLQCSLMQCPWDVWLCGCEWTSSWSSSWLHMWLSSTFRLCFFFLVVCCRV